MKNPIVIFSGPTISHKEASQYLDAIYLPPAKQGDVYAAWLQYKPAVIGMIDGHFENVPAPWHKEMLWVMSQGVTLYGASSMGALRAAELHQYGMIGVGEIFEAYKSGEIQDDDEVAVIHGPAEIGYPVLCEAMVSIRKTLQEALELGIVDQSLHDAVIQSTKATFYRDRTYPAALAELENEFETTQLSAWLEHNRCDLKRADAILMLKRIASGIDTVSKPQTYEFADTEFWRTMKRQIEEQLV